MCLAIYKPAGVRIAEEHFHNAAETNDDGIGFAAVKDGKLVVRKGYWLAEKFVLDFEPYAQCQAIIHFRMATHGGVSAKNCHPFVLPGLAVVHNGVIDCGQDVLAGGQSDTGYFVNEILAPIHAKDRSWFLSDQGRDTVAECVGASNKLIFLAPSGEYQIVNEEQGQWEDGVWYSNDSFRGWNYGYGGYRHLAGEEEPWYDMETDSINDPCDVATYQELPLEDQAAVEYYLDQGENLRDALDRLGNTKTLWANII